MGCQPSLSSMPAADSRTLADALDEISAWLQQPANARELLVLMLDDQANLQSWGQVPALLEQLRQAFGLRQLLTPAELQAGFGGRWAAGCCRAGGRVAGGLPRQLLA
jgi:hypothetical protein